MNAALIANAGPISAKQNSSSPHGTGSLRDRWAVGVGFSAMRLYPRAEQVERKAEHEKHPDHETEGARPESRARKPKVAPQDHPRLEPRQHQHAGGHERASLPGGADARQHDGPEAQDDESRPGL